MATDVTNFPRETTIREMANAMNMIAVAQASNMGSIESWETIKQLVRQGLGPKAFPIGSQLVATHSDYGNVVFDVVAHNQHSDPAGHYLYSMTLQMHDVIYNRQVDNTEALLYCPTGLAAGTYHFTLLSGYDTTYGGGKTLQFTITTPVPSGGVVMFPWAYNTQSTATKISTYESRSATVALETVAVSEGTDGVDLGTADGKTENMNHTHRIRYGSNNWGESAARQWLNSEAAAGAWWNPQTIFDRPPSYASTAGFLNGFDPEFVAAMGAVDIVTAKNTVYEAGNDVGGSYTTRDRVFPPSMTEVGFGNNNGIAEGSVMPYYVGATNTDRIKYDITNASTARYWWLRSPVPSGAGGVRLVGTSGALYSDGAHGGLGLAAACVIF